MNRKVDVKWPTRKLVGYELPGVPYMSYYPFVFASPVLGSCAAVEPLAVERFVFGTVKPGIRHGMHSLKSW